MSNDTNLEPTEPTEQLPQGGPRAARPPLRRSDGIVGGVAAGVADYLNLAPWLVRLGFIVLAFFGGLGILLYLAGWLVIPAQDAEQSIAERWLSGLNTGPSWVGAALIALAALLIITRLDIARPGLAWAVALLVLGVLLYRSEGPPREPTVGDRPDQAAPKGEALRRAGADSKDGQEPVGRPPRTPRKRSQRRSLLGRLTLAAGLITLGIVGLLDGAEVIYPEPRHYLAVAVMVVGAGLVVGAFWGRSRMLIVLGLVLVFAMGIATIEDTITAIEGRTEVHQPASASDVRTAYELDLGTLTIDLTLLELEGEVLDFSADLGAGELEVILPAGTGATIDSRVGVGKVDVLGRTSEGLGVGRSVRVDGSRGTFDVTLRVGAGRILVSQEAN